MRTPKERTSGAWIGGCENYTRMDSLKWLSLQALARLPQKILREQKQRTGFHFAFGEPVPDSGPEKPRKQYGASHKEVSRDIWEREKKLM